VRKLGTWAVQVYNDQDIVGLDKYIKKSRALKVSVRKKTEY
jgi:hypothetical protein